MDLETGHILFSFDTSDELMEIIAFLQRKYFVDIMHSDYMEYIGLTENITEEMAKKWAKKIYIKELPLPFYKHYKDPKTHCMQALYSIKSALKNEKYVIIIKDDHS